MGKANKVVLCGMKGIGKTSMLEQLIYENFEKQDIHPTIEDIYVASVDTDRGTKETLRFYDIEGFGALDNSEIYLPKQYHSIADAFVLVYAVDNRQSFDIVDLLKKDIDKNKEKRETLTYLLKVINVGISAVKYYAEANAAYVPNSAQHLFQREEKIMIVMIGMSCKTDRKRQVDPSFAVSWATREKIRHFDVAIPDRKSLLPPFTYLASKLNPPPTKTGFAPLGISRKAKE